MEYLENARNLLEKIKTERNSLNAKVLDKSFSFTIFNIAVSLNHIFEWFYKDSAQDIELRKKCIKEFNPYEIDRDKKKYFKDYIDQILVNLPVNEKQKQIRLICNDYKHFKLAYIAKSEEKPIYLSVAGNMRAGNITSVAGYYESYSCFITDKYNNHFDLLMLFDDLITEWTKFLAQI